MDGLSLVAWFLMLQALMVLSPLSLLFACTFRCAWICLCIPVLVAMRWGLLVMAPMWGRVACACRREAVLGGGIHFDL